MDLKDPKTQKILLGVLVGLLIIYFWYARIFSKNSEKIDQKQVQYENLLTNLKNVELKAKSFESLKEEYNKLLERYQRVELLLPEENQVPEFLTQLHSAAQTTQSSITQILPLGVTPRGFYNSFGYQLELVGDYNSLGEFLANVANFPFIAHISEVFLTGVPGDMQGKGKEETINASFKLFTYYIIEGEKIKKIEF
jgi:Tfp pilus assembly protein PilO